MFLPENQAEVMEGVEMLLTEIITVLHVEKKEVINQLKVATTELQKENTEKTTTTGSGERDVRRSSVA
jgi:activator of 2-hydroxyglutaryl-CoA dehydratase